MHPNKQRIAIAEACGWKSRPSYPGDYQWLDPEGFAEWLPHFVYDLNAMHEAEKVLTDEQWNDYAHSLFDIAHPWDDFGLFEETVRYTAHATAAQRAEAFLKTLNLWQDD